MTNREREKKPNWLSLVMILAFLAPQLILPLAIFGGIGYLFYLGIKTGKQSAASQKTTYTTPRSQLDDCPKPLFCFHKDKAEHHVRRGKEMDPWDRPDIDISKYQRKG